MKENSLENKKEINNIHFLVHPGFTLFVYGPQFDDEDSVTLLENYIEKAKKMGEEELMVIFAPAKDARFVADVRNNDEEYTKAIHSIRNILGRRLIVLSNDGEIHESEKERIWDKIKNIANQRGYVFAKKLTAEAYGEYLSACVVAVAQNMHQASQMPKSRPIKLKVNLTEQKINREEDVKEYWKKYKNPNTKLDFSKD